MKTQIINLNPFPKGHEAEANYLDRIEDGRLIDRKNKKDYTAQTTPFASLLLSVFSIFIICLTYLKKEQFYKDIPVVIFTTSQNKTDIERSRKIGATLFFTKPSDFDIFCNTRAKILEMIFTQMQFAF